MVRNRSCWTAAKAAIGGSDKGRNDRRILRDLLYTVSRKAHQVVQLVEPFNSCSDYTVVFAEPDEVPRALRVDLFQ